MPLQVMAEPDCKELETIPRRPCSMCVGIGAIAQVEENTRKWMGTFPCPKCDATGLEDVHVKENLSMYPFPKTTTYRGGSHARYTVEEVCAALTTCDGFITKTAKFLDCARITLKRYMVRHPEIGRRQKELKEARLLRESAVTYRD